MRPDDGSGMCGVAHQQELRTGNSIENEPREQYGKQVALGHILGEHEQRIPEI